MTKAVLFDLDGTLVDTSEYIFQAFEHTIGQHKLSPHTRERIAKTVGKSIIEAYKELSELAQVDHLIHTHHQFQLKNIHLVKAFESALETMKSLEKKGFPMAVVTSRRRDTAIESLEKVGLTPFFKMIYALEDVKIPKPDPEGIFKALAHFKIEPHEAIMVGDTVIDVMTGKNAGTKTVGVTYGFHGKDIAHAKPDHLIHDLKELLHIV